MARIPNLISGALVEGAQGERRDQQRERHRPDRGGEQGVLQRPRRAGPRLGPLPQSTRIACTRDQTGFHSAIVRTSRHRSVGANALERNVIGNIGANIKPLTASGERIDRAHEDAEPDHGETEQQQHREGEQGLADPVVHVPAISRPVTDMTTMPILEWMSAPMLRPMSTDTPAMGSERNRSMMPLPRSTLSPFATMNAENAMVCPMIPGISHSRYEPPWVEDRGAEDEREQQREHDRLNGHVGQHLRHPLRMDHAALGP